MSSFVVNGKCLSYHGPLLYEAKVLMIHEHGSDVVLTKDGEVPVNTGDIPESLKNETCYYIHYKGWKASWDEWVGNQRIREYNDENLKLQKELKQEANKPQTSTTNDSSKPTKASSKRKTESTDGNTMKKANHEGKKNSSRLQESDRKNEIVLLIPDSLKTVLVDDWELITKDHKLISLPVKITVNEILETYQRSFGSGVDITEAEKVKEFSSGIRLYFNRSLGKLLLYRYERHQYLDLYESKSVPDDASYENKEIDYCNFYGGEHLLRLLVILPNLLANSMMDQASVALLKGMIENFLIFLDNNRASYFLKSYENSTPHYEANARFG